VVTCGIAGESCCDETACNTGLACNGGTCTLVLCGGLGEPCCDGAACNNGLTCEAGTCSALSTADSGADTGPGTDATEDAGALAPDFAWYLLDETSGTTAHDSSVNHYDITNLTGVTWSQGASFDSSLGVCGWASVAAELRQPPVTITAWQTAAARVDSTSNDICYEPFASNGVSADIQGASGYGLGLNVWADGNPGSGLTLETGQLGCTSSFTTVGSFVAGQEYFVALALTVTTATIYVDGASIATLPATPPPAASPTLLQLGCLNEDPVLGSKRFFNGRMRDVRVYKRVLSATEVQQLYVSGPSP
jgi:hypothetical protein